MLTQEQIWPGTVSGWVALFASIIGLATILVGGGRMLQKISDQTEKVKKINDQVEKLDPELAAAVKEMDREYRRIASHIESGIDELKDRYTVVEHTLWGAKGDNGMALAVRELVKEVARINERNRIVDALEARRQGAVESGHEERERRRRREDRILSGEEDA
jgi:predicted  nucleic acid-binding Zn-ribbon protein